MNMTSLARQLDAMVNEPPSSDIMREALHDALRDYVRDVLEGGQQTEETEMLVSSAYNGMIECGSLDDLAWAQDRLGRAVAALDDGDYALVHAHTANFEKMSDALQIRIAINSVIGRALGD